jgi:hypothetical protein
MAGILRGKHTQRKKCVPYHQALPILLVALFLAPRLHAVRKELTTAFMKPSSWNKQLGLALPLERAAGQSNQTNHPSKNEVGLDVSHHTRVFPRGGEKLFFLTSSFIG